MRSVFTDYNVPDIYNSDGTAFKRYPISTIIAYEALINYFNLPKFCLPNIQELRLF